MIHREHGESDERLAERLAHQWATIRAADRRPVPEPIATGPSNFSRAQVPWGVDLAAAWAWRFLVIAAAGYLIARVLGFFAVITLPIVVALLISALVSPLVRPDGADQAARRPWPRSSSCSAGSRSSRPC